MSRVIICGGGLSGGLAGLALAKRRPDVDLLLVEQEGRFGGNHVWSFFDSDIPDDRCWLLDLVRRRRWPEHEIRFPERARTIALGYNSVQSSDLDAAIRAHLRPEQFRLGGAVSELGPNHVVVDGERITADCVIDARGPRAMRSLDLGWQKFVGRVYQFREQHEVVRPMIMDATVEQIDGFRFIYQLPLSATELLVEDTYYSASPVLDREQLGARLEAAALNLGKGQPVFVSEETGVLPVVIRGKIEQLWPADDVVPRLGLAGGFFHPTTGYSLPDSVANAVLLAEQRDFRTSAIASLLRSKAKQVWSQRSFFQLLNRMLFNAAAPDERYRVLEHFYRLPPALIARFYAARLTTLDKLRIVSGRPPVPISRALSALRRTAA